MKSSSRKQKCASTVKSCCHMLGNGQQEEVNTNPWMFDLHGVEYFAEVRTSKVCLRLETSEDAPSGHALEMLFTNVLCAKTISESLSHRSRTKLNSRIHSSAQFPSCCQCSWHLLSYTNDVGLNHDQLGIWYASLNCRLRKKHCNEFNSKQLIAFRIDD